VGWCRTAASPVAIEDLRISAALLLMGCVHDQAPVPVATATPPPKPAPALVYFKQGASNEDFQRARANCLMRAEIAESSSTDPDGFARAATWMTVYRTCMRADGWVLVPKT
jgi:hypothetical protein